MSGAGNVDGMLATIEGTGLLRRGAPAGGVGAGRSGTEAVELTDADGTRCCCWPTLQHTSQPLQPSAVLQRLGTAQ